MRTIISAASLLACAFSLDAQISATLSRSSDGLDDVRIRNNSAISLAAFVVYAKNTGAALDTAPVAVYSDPLIEPTARPLLAGEELLVIHNWGLEDRFGIRHHLLEEPVVVAGILADGSSVGDAFLLARLLFRRSNMLLAAETALEALSDAQLHNIPQSQLIDQFKKMVDLLNRWYLPVEQQVGRNLYQSIIEKLMNLPQGQIGSPFPPATFVAEETATLIPLRSALMESEPHLPGALPVEK
jgi:hypothetical protein